MTKYTTRLIKKNFSMLKFADILDAANKLHPDPIQEVQVSYKFYQELLESTKDLIGGKKPQQNKIFLGSLYGVKIIIDPELKPGEWKII